MGTFSGFPPPSRSCRPALHFRQERQTCRLGSATRISIRTGAGSGRTSPTPARSTRPSRSPATWNPCRNRPPSSSWVPPWQRWASRLAGDNAGRTKKTEWAASRHRAHHHGRGTAGRRLGRDAAHADLARYTQATGCPRHTRIRPRGRDRALVVALSGSIAMALVRTGQPQCAPRHSFHPLYARLR